MTNPPEEGVPPNLPEPRTDVELTEEAANVVLAAAVQCKTVFKPDLLKVAATLFEIFNDMDIGVLTVDGHPYTQGEDGDG